MPSQNGTMVFVEEVFEVVFGTTVSYIQRMASLNPQPADLRILAFAELIKPELTGLSVLTAMLAFMFAEHGPFRLWDTLLLGGATLLVGGGAAALNQFMERGHDLLMKRTERRPIPSGRVRPGEGLALGVAASAAGVWSLWILFGVLPAVLAVLTLGLYLGFYTPLKRRSAWNTLVGAFPGALPTLIGWSASEGRISAGGWMIFGILFLWQFPHFFSLAWMYRKDYARAGYKMLPVLDDEQGTLTNRVNLLSITALLLVTSLMTVLHFAGVLFLVGSFLLGLGFLGVAWSVRRAQRDGDTRLRTQRPSQLFFASLIYLPLVLVLGLLDKV